METALDKKLELARIKNPTGDVELGRGGAAGR
jgi:hypothetical protein